MAIVPEITITITPIIDIKLNSSEKKIIPYKLPQIIWVKKKGLIILLYLPAIWYALFQAHIEIIIRTPALENKINSFKDGTKGSNIKKI